MQNSLSNKVILITGASRGIGRAVASALAAQGATCILLARTIKDLELLHDQIVAKGHPQPAICGFNLCTATPEDYDDLRRMIAKQYGRLDGLIHNAGILGSLTPLEYYNLQTWYQVLQVNLNSVFLLTQACLPLLKQAPQGSVVFTSPTHATKPKAHWGAYGVAAAGCHAFMQMLASECQNITQIRVNAIQLERIKTELRAAAYPAEQDANLCLPEEIVAQYVYLMSDASRHISGKVIAASEEFALTN